MRDCGLPKGYEDQCCLNRCGICTLDTADYRDIDRAVGQRGCGFINVNDRYLLWKYGVPYKDLVCGNCQHFKGETHGECTNDNVEPHTKGITVNGEKDYVDCKDRYSGAMACKLFKRKEAEEVVIETCETCEFSEDYGESVEYIKCHEGKRAKDVRKKQPACHNYVPVSDVIDDEPEGDLEEQLEELLKDGDEKEAADRELLSALIGKEIKTHYNTGGIVTNVIGPHNMYGPGSWSINYTPDGKKSKSPFIINSIKIENGVITCEGKPLQIVEQKEPESCANCSVDKEDCMPYQACMNEGLLPEECVCENWRGVKKVIIDNDKKCISKNDSCSLYCKHNEGCSLLLVSPRIQKEIFETASNPDTGCEVYRNIQQKHVSVQAISTTEDKPTRPLLVIEAEINFYKQQTATGIIEIGKRLIEAKQQLQHGEWGKWLEEKVDFSQRTANQFMRVADEFSNSQSISNLGTRKLFLLLDVPTEERQQFIEDKHSVNGKEKSVDEMTTRELQEAIKARKEAEKRAQEAEQHYKNVSESYQRLESVNSKHYQEKEELRKKVQEIEEQLKNTKPEIIEKVVEVEKVPEHIKRQLDSMTAQLNQYKQESWEYKQLSNQIAELKNHRDKLNEQIHLFDELSDLRAGVVTLLKDNLAPVRYSNLLSAASYNPELAEMIDEITGAVRQWLDDMTVNRGMNIIEAKVVNDDE